MVHGVNNNFKVSTVSDPATDPFGQDPKSQQVEESIEDFFGIFDDGGTTSGDYATDGAGDLTDPINDPGWTMFDGQENPYGGSIDRFKNIPTVEQILERNPKVRSRKPLLEDQYKLLKKDLEKLDEIFETNLANCFGPERRDLIRRRELIKDAIGLCNEQLVILADMKKEDERTYQLELTSGRDVNKDNWLGAPTRAGSYYIKRVKKNGKEYTVYIDAITKSVVPYPLLLDPTTSPALTTDNSLRITTDPHNPGEEVADAYLQLNAEADDLNASHLGYASVEWHIPNAVWVRRSDDADSGVPYVKEWDDKGEHKGERMSPADFVVGENGGICQEPQDLEKYMLMQVTKVVIDSEDTDVGAPGNSDRKFSNHWIVLYNGKDIIAKIRIEGYQITDPNAEIPPYAVTANGKTWVPPSTRSFSVVQEGMGKIEIDASGFSSDCHHIMPESVLQEWGISPPNPDDPEAEENMAYYETVDNFTVQGQQTTRYYDGNDWDNYNDVHNWDDDNPNAPDGKYAHTKNDKTYYDRYAAPDIDLGPACTLRDYRAGLFIKTNGGVTTGTHYNDIVVQVGIDELMEKNKGKLPDEACQIRPDDPYYQNAIDSLGGNDMVMVKSGHTHIAGATFVHANLTSDDKIYIDPLFRGSFDKERPQNKVYIKVEGGARCAVANDDEASIDEIDEDPEDYKDALSGDYYDVDSNVRVWYDPEDKDIQRDDENRDQTKDQVTSEVLREQAAKAADELRDAINKVPEIDGAEIEDTWNAIMGAEMELLSEMDSFFAEVSSEISALFDLMQGGADPSALP